MLCHSRIKQAVERPSKEPQDGSLIMLDLVQFPCICWVLILGARTSGYRGQLDVGIQPRATRNWKPTDFPFKIYVIYIYNTLLNLFCCVLSSGSYWKRTCNLQASAPQIPSGLTPLVLVSLRAGWAIQARETVSESLAVGGCLLRSRLPLRGRILLLFLFSLLSGWEVNLYFYWCSTLILT